MSDILFYLITERQTSCVVRRVSFQPCGYMCTLRACDARRLCQMCIKRDELAVFNNGEDGLVVTHTLTLYSEGSGSIPGLAVPPQVFLLFYYIRYSLHYYSFEGPDLPQRNDQEFYTTFSSGKLLHLFAFIEIVQF